MLTVPMPRACQRRHAVVAVQVRHDRAPRGLDVAGRAPQVCQCRDPCLAALLVASGASLDGQDDVTTRLRGARVEALPEVDPRRVQCGPLRAVAAVALEIVDPPAGSSASETRARVLRRLDEQPRARGHQVREHAP